MRAGPSDALRVLIVNADDYGLTPAVSRGILRAHREGIVTSTSVLAIAPGFGPSVGALRDTPGIGVGAHLAAVGEDPPLLTAREVPTLVDDKGRLATSWRQFVPRVAAGRIDLEDLRREFKAQLTCLQQAGLTIGHVDTHQHLHLWPKVGAVVMDVAQAAGIRALRIVRSSSRGPTGITVRRLANRLERTARERGFSFPAAGSGLDEAGTLDADRLVPALERLARAPGSSAELATHPGEAGDPDLTRYRWGYVWDSELEALVDPAVRRRVSSLGFKLGTYADLEAA
ncbi:MAG TPA: ChbG/HpnK family deacetylase [Acidimicrobiales bacterium]|nr:ChbG/HpnK family deacetylase [Acidimicrobiales bacterium]